MNQILGYQITNNEKERPQQFSETEVLSMQLADYWMRHFSERKDWVLKPIYSGDIEKAKLIDLEDPPDGE